MRFIILLLLINFTFTLTSGKTLDLLQQNHLILQQKYRSEFLEQGFVHLKRLNKPTFYLHHYDYRSTFSNTTSSSTVAATNNIKKNVLSLRGGFIVASSTSSTTSTSHLAQSLQDYSGAASAFFSGIRLPATLIVGASLNNLFALSRQKNEANNQQEVIAMKLCNTFSFVSCLLSLITVVVATAVNVSILHGGYNAMATTGYALLKREFGLEFLTCRLSLQSGLLSFLIALSNRVLYEFGLLKPGKEDLRNVLTFTMLSVIFGLLSYINSTLYCWDNLFYMSVHFMKEIARLVLSVDKMRPFRFGCMVSTVMSTIYGVRSIYKRDQK
jgi:hypothetical protein